MAITDPPTDLLGGPARGARVPRGGLLRVQEPARGAQGARLQPAFQCGRTLLSARLVPDRRHAGLHESRLVLRHGRVRLRRARSPSADPLAPPDAGLPARTSCPGCPSPPPDLDLRGWPGIPRHVRTGRRLVRDGMALAHWRERRPPRPRARLRAGAALAGRPASQDPRRISAGHGGCGVLVPQPAPHRRVQSRAGPARPARLLWRSRPDGHRSGADGAPRPGGRVPRGCRDLAGAQLPREPGRREGPAPLAPVGHVHGGSGLRGGVPMRPSSGSSTGIGCDRSRPSSLR